MHSGFSLLELSIVLVIIGLLAGGVMTGQSLIRAAELRSISTDMTRYYTAINAFRDKYQALPGDMKNATSFWGAAAADVANCKLTAGTGTATCNGDGNGQIGGDWIIATNYENFRSWQHLANAAMIEGKYSGIASYPSDSFYFAAEPGINIPKSKVGTAGFSLLFVRDTLADPDEAYAGSYGNSLWFGAHHDGWISYDPIIAPAEAWMVDTKLDDGKPGMGRVVAPPPTNSSNPDCALGAYTAPASATYALTQTGAKCMLIFKLGV